MPLVMPMEMNISVNIRQQSGGGSIHLEENFTFGPLDFNGFAAIMKRFHDLAQEIKQQNLATLAGAEQRR